MSDNTIPTLNPKIYKIIEWSIGKHADAIWEINRKIWSSPEKAWKETKAHDAICDYFDYLNSSHPEYTVHRHAYGIPTSFLIEATTLQPPLKSLKVPPSVPTIVFNAEYDALSNVLKEDTDPPQYGPAHACGHNLIASASIGAFIACWEALKTGKCRGAVRLLGTPAEETGGGKIKLVEKGAYNGIDACMMVHPGPLTSNGNLKALAFTRSLASQRIIADFFGAASHAGLAPEKGKNALDALVNSYVAIRTLRQQLHSSFRVAGIVKNGGKAANTIPDHTTAVYSIRAESRKDLDDLCGKVVPCFDAGAKAEGCTVEVDDKRAAYWNLVSNEFLCKSFTQRMNEFGVNTVYQLAEITDKPGAATDQGNVSHFIPAMQGAFFIDSSAINHTPRFADAAGTLDAFERALDCSKGLAAVGFDVIALDGWRQAMWRCHIADTIARAKAVAQDYGMEVPGETWIDELLDKPPAPLRDLFASSGMKREQVVGALMAADVFFSQTRGLPSV